MRSAIRHQRPRLQHFQLIRPAVSKRQTGSSRHSRDENRRNRIILLHHLSRDNVSAITTVTALLVLSQPSTIFAISGTSRLQEKIKLREERHILHRTGNNTSLPRAAFNRTSALPRFRRLFPLGFLSIVLLCTQCALFQLIGLVHREAIF